MRMMLKIEIPVEAGNSAISSGKLPEILGQTMERLQPEAAYFMTENGRRSGFLIFDLADLSQIPVIAEPLFQGMNAAVTFAPVMNIEDLQKGLSQLG